jgi:hypothetical protein
MSYDLARLRRHGLIERRPHSNTYDITAEGQRIACFYAKGHNRLLRPLLGADKPPAPIPLRRALSSIDQRVRGYIDDARKVNARLTNQDKHQSSNPQGTPGEKAVAMKDNAQHCDSMECCFPRLWADAASRG